MNKPTYLFRVLFALVLTVLFIRCEDESIENSPIAAPIELVQKSAKIGKLDILSKLKLSVINMSECGLDSATGYLDKIYLKSIDGELVEIWDSLEWFDFLDLEAGIGRDIGIVPIPSGTYTHAICDIVSAGVVYKGKDYDCIVPGEQMILEFIEPVVVSYHLSPELIVEIDASKSFYPVFSRSLYRDYFKYLMKQRRKGASQHKYISFDKYKKNKEPKYFVMNPYLIAYNHTVTGSAAGYLGDFALGGYPAFGVTLSLWDENGLVTNEYGLPAEAVPFTEYILDEESLDTVFGPGDFWIPYVLPGDYQLKVEETSYILDPFWLQTTTDPTSPSFVPYLDIHLVKGNFNVATSDIELSPYLGGGILPAGTIMVY